ncbi:MAG TPA: heat-inducible transcriptional repressor HrcA, partial [Gammaproteobacteria bacterium]|nr:heat-inducible transcriptional repressor HrcA [Gammaproteobacteria bacterium]
SPHTSAGRIPTTRGYRFFIDSLLTVTPLSEDKLADFAKELDPIQDRKALISSTSQLLSRITHLTGLVTLPRQEKLILRHLEFLPLTQRRVLVILVVNEREVQNRILELPRAFSASELQMAANYLNESYIGHDLYHVRHELLHALKTTKEKMDDLMQAVIDVANEALNLPEQENDYVVTGQNHLFNQVEEHSMKKLHHLFEAFNEKRDLLHLLEHCLQADGVQIFLGEESGCNVLGDYSLVTAPYSVSGQRIGVLGVIGSARMPYDQIIPVVDVTAKILSSALNQT